MTALALVAAVLSAAPGPQQLQTPPPLAWTVRETIPALVTIHDELTVHADVINTGEERLHVRTPGRYGLMVVLDGPLGRRFAEVHWSTGNGAPNPGEVALGVHFDVRSLFGPLAPADYTLELRLHYAAYTVSESRKSYTTKSLHHTLRFEVRPPLDRLFRGDPEPVRLEWTDEPPNISGETPLLLLNESKNAIAVPGYFMDQSSEQPLPALGHYEYGKFDGSWEAANRVGHCGTGVGEVTVPPGGSLGVTLSNRIRDGVVRGVLPYRVVGSDRSELPLAARSLGRVEASHLRGFAKVDALFDENEGLRAPTPRSKTTKEKHRPILR